MLTRICRTAAVTAACLLAAIGGVVVAAFSPWALVGLGVVATLVGAAVPEVYRSQQVGGRRSTQRRGDVRIGVTAGAATFCMLLVATAVIAILGGAAAPVVLVLLVGTGAGVWRHRAAWRAWIATVAHDPAPPTAAARPAPATPAPATPAPRPVAPRIVPAALTVAELCTVWHRSYWLLHDTPSGSARAEIVATRERLLDELEQRDPIGFGRWLDSGARAGSDPRRYLTADRTDTDRTTP